MAVDRTVLKALQLRFATLQSEERNRRRLAGEPELGDADARQHGLYLIRQVVAEHADQLADVRTSLSEDDQAAYSAALEARLFGAGTLDDLLHEPEAENININGFDNVFVQYADGTKRRADPVEGSDEELVNTIRQLAATVGLSSRPFDTANPQLDLRLPDGARLSAVLGVSPRPSVSIRINRLPDVTLKDLTANATLTPELASFLTALVQARSNVMICGETNSGKTVLLRAMAAEIDPSERIITIERALELGLADQTDRHPDAVQMEERLPNSEGLGAVSMADLLRRTLRMNPSRVIVGEVLGDEVVTMLNAMSQGNDGSLSTIHANSPRDALKRLSTYAIQAPERLAVEATNLLIASSIEYVIFLRRLDVGDDGTPRQQRIVESIQEINSSGEGVPLTSMIWESPDGVAPAVRTDAAIQRDDRLKRVQRWWPR
ncbi:CpaF family protein [Solicola gregarius]|uniref:Flp pilus assembly complex ATPase component TadA n=1 Tax=Solicola gregarius TaxID=2908642 RepID=A0AA46TK17_9ACTN|nr:ATPase, T2SS/T4P/T4SS family [Solicola gregarius]UYM06319.1 Flp pilus assembly complex ATPase component TadA [Solicola gregarius]